MPASSSATSRSRSAWIVLGALQLLEAVFGVIVLVLAVRAALGSNDPLLQSLSIIIMLALCIVWVGVSGVAALRSRPSWARGSALTIHVLLFAVGAGCLQLFLGPWQLGVGIALVGIAGFVAAILARPDDLRVEKTTKTDERR